MCVQCKVAVVVVVVVVVVDITFILLSRVLKALFRSGVFSDGETACHCGGKSRLSAQPTEHMLGVVEQGGAGRGGVEESWARVEEGEKWGKMGRNGGGSSQVWGLGDGAATGRMGAGSGGQLKMVDWTLPLSHTATTITLL